MSGIEIAGLVLGAIPLVISVIEHYANGVATMGRFYRYQRELRMLIAVLDTEKKILKNTCELLLEGVASEAEMYALTREPFGPLWKDEVFQEKVRARLRTSYNDFQNTIKDVYSAIQEINDRLGIGHDGAVNLLDSHTLRRFVKRAIFSLSQRSFDELLSRIKNGNSTLRVLTQQSLNLEPGRVKRSHSRLLKVVRDTSNSVYQALKGNLVCLCTHGMALHLSGHSVDFEPIHEDDQISGQLIFRVAISSSFAGETSNQACGNIGAPSSSRTPSTDNPTTAIWGEIVLKKSTQTSTLSSSRPSSLIVPSTRSKGKHKAANFSEPTQIALASTISPTTSNAGVLVVPQLSLCRSLDQARRSLQILRQPHESPLGNTQQPNHSSILVDITDIMALGRIREFEVCLSSGLEAVETTAPDNNPVMTPSVPGLAMPAVSLRDALESASEREPMLTYKNRLSLAVAIAQGVLQLQHTPWLPPTLYAEDILFAQPTDNSPRDPSNHRIFVTRRQTSDQVQILSIGGQTLCPPRKLPLLQQPNQLLLSLGILLTELILGKSIGQPQRLQENITLDLLDDREKALGLLDRVDEVAIQNYGSAVRFCLNPHMQWKSIEQERDKDYQFQAGVVALLERDLEIVQDI